MPRSPRANVAGKIQIRSKRGLIEKFNESMLPEVDNATEIPGHFEAFREQERSSALDQLPKEELLDAEKLKKLINLCAYTGTKPLSNPDIIELIDRPLILAERG